MVTIRGANALDPSDGITKSNRKQRFPGPHSVLAVSKQRDKTKGKEFRSFQKAWNFAREMAEKYPKYMFWVHPGTLAQLKENQTDALLTVHMDGKKRIVTWM